MISYNKIKIYYFSGTGNSLNVAKWFQQVAIEQHCDCEIVNIAKIDRRAVPKPEYDTLVVFVSPVHGFNYPPIMLHFIQHFPKGKNPVVLMNTRGGMLIGTWNTPGVSGVAFYLSACFLKWEGYAVKAMVPVDLPSNWVSLHPGLNERTVQFLHKRNKLKVQTIVSKILSGKSDFRSFREIIQDTLLAPIALGYYFAGRFMLAKTFYASADCDNCGLCEKQCPVKAIISVDKRMFWTFNCESCMKCMSNCPKRAIETAHGFIVGWLVLASVLLGLLFQIMDTTVFKIENELLFSIVKTMLTLAFLALGYRLVHYLMRFSFFERMMVYTSLTKYRFWGRRYKALKQ